MINIHIICLGKLKEKYLSDACNEYIKRLGTMCKLTITELTPKPLPENPSKATILQTLNAEQMEIESKIPNNSFVITLCVEGKELSSEEFSKKISSTVMNGKSAITLIIGSSFGLSDSLKEKSNFRMSMSKMTFPHQLTRVILLEQLYRALTISINGKYHK